MEILEILSTGVGLSIQDFGRPGWRRFGVPQGGAMDRHSAAQANALLGNRQDAPLLEILMQGAKLRVLQDTWIALAGADLGCKIAPWSACQVKAGTVLHFPENRSGLWAYLAAPGGIVAEHWLGSASVDARNGLGEPLQRGSLLSAEGLISIERVGRRVLAPELQLDFPKKTPTFHLLRGPQFSLFSVQARAQLVAAQWTVSARSDRSGFRLEGPNLEVPDSIKSEPVLPGSFQIPGNGQPIITMADGPTVGGYAKLALLREADLDRFAQCRPGTHISFQWPLMLNCDLGENESAAQTERLMARADAANICCGMHAGSEAKTRATLKLAKRYGVLVGAHPGLPDHGGRGAALPTTTQFEGLLNEQLGSFFGLAAEVGVAVDYVKLHGTLYHAVEQDKALAAVYLKCIKSLDTKMGICSLTGGRVASDARAAGIPVREEAFADRAYTAEGQLVPRGRDGAVITTVSAAVERVRVWQQTGLMPTLDGQAISLQAEMLCVHSDSPNSLQLLEALQAVSG